MSLSGRQYLATVVVDVMSLISDCKYENEKFCIDMGEGKDEDNASNKATMAPIEYYSWVYNTFENLPVDQRNANTYDQALHLISKVYVGVFNQYILGEKSEANLLSNLALYFKETSWTIADGGWKANKASIQSAIMYALLIAYSLVFFISYTKRLFYVVLLILMAPVVVVFDFFMKFGK